MRPVAKYHGNGGCDVHVPLCHVIWDGLRRAMLHSDATGEYGDMSVIVFSSVRLVLQESHITYEVSLVLRECLCVHSVMDTWGFVLTTL